MHEKKRSHQVREHRVASVHNHPDERKAMNVFHSKPARECKQCGADISARHYNATLCFSCLKSWGTRTGAAKACSDVKAAISRGELQNPRNLKCADCGCVATDYDHRDYNKPLDVQPVCRSCNKKRGAAIPIKVAA